MKRDAKERELKVRAADDERKRKRREEEQAERALKKEAAAERAAGMAVDGAETKKATAAIGKKGFGVGAAVEAPLLLGAGGGSAGEGSTGGAAAGLKWRLPPIRQQPQRPPRPIWRSRQPLQPCS